VNVATAATKRLSIRIRQPAITTSPAAPARPCLECVTGNATSATGYQAPNSNTTGNNVKVALPHSTQHDRRDKNTADGGAPHGTRPGTVAAIRNTLYKNTSGNYNHASGYQSHTRTRQAPITAPVVTPRSIPIPPQQYYCVVHPAATRRSEATISRSVIAGRCGQCRDPHWHPGDAEGHPPGGVRSECATGSAPVMVTATGQLGIVSPRGAKETFASMGDTSDRLPQTPPSNVSLQAGRQPKPQAGSIMDQSPKKSHR